ncbi:UNVERIFIED_CONTAM: hypothetical protein Sradi_4078000 [Sesamum radiatum]|uniref:Uncharacterized protein n=1 Tax=Sesamum radiatum TaxID=300843 RepID=A0AAW2PL74_SESRA
MNAVRGFPSYDSYSKSYNPGFYRNKGKLATHRESNLSTSQENGETRNSSIPRAAITNRDTSSGEREYDDTRGEKELHIIEQAPMEIKENEETLEDTKAQDKKVESDLIPVPSSNICVLLSANRMSKLKEDEKEILNTSLKVKINTPVLELKASPDHLQCLYLGVSKKLSNIISQGLAKEQNELTLNEREVLRNCKEKTRRFTTFMILRKLFEVGKKVLFYKVRLKLIPGKLSSSWLGRFEGVNVFSHGVARIKCLDIGQIFKVVRKLFLSGDEVITIIGIALTSLQQLTH